MSYQVKFIHPVILKKCTGNIKTIKVILLISPKLFENVHNARIFCFVCNTHKRYLVTNSLKSLFTHISGVTVL